MTDIITSLEKPRQNKAHKPSDGLNKELFKWYGWGTPLGLSIFILSAALAACWLIFAAVFALRFLGR